MKNKSFYFCWPEEELHCLTGKFYQDTSSALRHLAKYNMKNVNMHRTNIPKVAAWVCQTTIMFVFVPFQCYPKVNTEGRISRSLFVPRQNVWPRFESAIKVKLVPQKQSFFLAPPCHAVYLICCANRNRWHQSSKESCHKSHPKPPSRNKRIREFDCSGALSILVEAWKLDNEIPHGPRF